MSKNISRDFQTEYDTLLASHEAQSGDGRRAGWITGRIHQIMQEAGEEIRRNWQGEYDLLLAASERAIGEGDSQAAATLAEAINELVAEAAEQDAGIDEKGQSRAGTA